MLVNKAGRSERSLGSQAEVRLCMHLIPSGKGYSTKVKDKDIKKNAPQMQIPYTRTCFRGNMKISQYIKTIHLL